MENLLFLLLVGVVGFINWLVQRADESKKNPASEEESASGEETTSPGRQATPGSEEERIRRFLEALGQPTSSPPPPRIERRKPTPRRAVALPQIGPFASPLPPLTTQPPADAPSPPMVVVPPAPQPKRMREHKTPIVPERPTFEIRTIEAPSSLEFTAGPSAGSLSNIAGVGSATSAASLSALLRSPDGLRHAIILREIFGPPRGLQSLSEVGTV